jgi:hypothetical protein
MYLGDTCVPLTLIIIGDVAVKDRNGSNPPPSLLSVTLILIRDVAVKDRNGSDPPPPLFSC